MRKTAAVSLAFLVVLGVVLIARCGDDHPEGNTMSMPEHRTLDVRDVMVYADGHAATYRVRTARDVLPGGLSAAMAPVMIDWKKSDIQPGGSLVLGNISHGGNPLAGVTVLRTVRVYPERLVTVQFVTVPLGGPKALAHGQLRFVFEDGGIELLGRDPSAVGEPDTITDLVMSWEAWRSPGVGYDVMTGLDAAAYELSLRCFSGPQRFLEDMLVPRPWTAYDLQLPGGREGLAELLRVTLIMGDGVARQVIGRLLGQAEEAWREAVPDPSTEDLSVAEAWLRLQAEMEAEGAAAAPGDSRLELTGDQTSYQTLLRSCATMALYNIDVTVARLLEAGLPAGGMRPVRTPELMADPAWMTELADAGWGKLLVNAPRALGFLRKNMWVVPGKIPGQLDDAGLVVHEDGKRKQQLYSLETITPWGHRHELLIR